MMSVAGQRHNDSEGFVSVPRELSGVIETSEGRLFGLRPVPARLGTAEDDLRSLGHPVRDGDEVVRLRLVHVFGQRDVDRPDPPVGSKPDREIASALERAPVRLVRQNMARNATSPSYQSWLPGTMNTGG